MLLLEVQQASQTSTRVVSGYSGFHSIRCLWIRPYLQLRGSSSFSLGAGAEGFLLSFDR